MRRGRVRAAAALAALLAGAAAAQPPELVTDRPDQTESASIVPPGSLQLETGGRFESDRDAGVEVERSELAGTLLRWGLAEGWELRLGWGGRVEETVDSGAAGRLRASGSDDASLGAKLRLAEGGGRRPAVALLAGASLPVGSSEISSERFDPELRLAVAHQLGERLGLGYNVGATWSTSAEPGGDRDTLARGLYTLSLGVAAGERGGYFAELFGDFELSRPGGAALSFDGGWTYKIRPLLQVDVAAGVGLTGDAPDWQVGAGLSWRWPR